ncbi:hypothetical protein LSAT2_022035 [Lamellibrachia satsuma]|nr:hypothetical protein LSAT2_022035 [Lamellibrachia satsuma]
MLTSAIICLAYPTLVPCGARWSRGRASDFQSKGPGFKTTCGRASDFSVEGTGVQNRLLPFRNLGNFVHPTLPVSFASIIQAPGCGATVCDAHRLFSAIEFTKASESRISETGIRREEMTCATNGGATEPGEAKFV